MITTLALACIFLLVSAASCHLLELSSTPDEQLPVMEFGEAEGHGEEGSPPPRCIDREEWQAVCPVRSGNAYHRYLRFHGLKPREGLGASLLRVAWVLHRAIAFDLEPVFVGPLMAGHVHEDFGDFMGLTHNPLLMIQDPEAFAKAESLLVPFPDGNDLQWFREQENRTSVVYEVDAMETEKKKWGISIPPPTHPSPTRGCLFPYQALRTIFWSAPRSYGRCRAFLPDDYFVPRQSDGERPWVLAVHVRRGDMVKFRDGVRSVPHTFFKAAIKSVLQGIAAASPAARVSVLVFSEGPSSMNGLQLPDEHGKAITWDIERESCLDVGLNCSQKNFLSTDMFDTFDCLAAADVLVGSGSSFSEAAAAVSTNVKVMLWEDQAGQDRVALNSTAAALSGAVSFKEKSLIEKSIADWWHCSAYARESAESDVEGQKASLFFQTVEHV